MEQKFISLLKSPIPKEKGQLLLQSIFIDSKTKEEIKAKAYNQLLTIGQSYLHYNFDIRFGVKQHEITFSYKDDNATYYLHGDDDIKWREVLKKYLNQKGFHQQFKPIKKIGKGNFASVYLVEKLENKLNFAVKAFSKEAAYSEENGKECLIKQIQIMRHLNHPNNMKLYEVFQSDNSLYIVFELLSGGQLYEKIKNKEKFTQGQIKKMVKGILQGLREMHSKNIMHRDLKPQNILLRSQTDYDCVIADYGLAQFADSDQYLFVRCGTPGYVAPEVINIKDMKTKYSPICDMFSLGLIFHLLVFGKSVFKGKSYNDVLAQNRSCDFHFNSTEYEECDQQIMDLMKKMLRVNPEERITAEQAISHPYFKSSQSQADSQAKMIKSPSISTESGSPMILHDKRKQVDKDSCLTFKMGKDNVMNGHTDTVGNVNSTNTKVSVFGLGLLKGVKMSKFVRPQEETESQNKENI